MVCGEAAGKTERGGRARVLDTRLMVWHRSRLLHAALFTLWQKRRVHIADQSGGLASSHQTAVDGG